jgi:hypothetical protein
MSGLGNPVLTGRNAEDVADSFTTQRPVAVHSCSRLGRVANPPGFSFTDWFRSGRRR